MRGEMFRGHTYGCALPTRGGACDCGATGGVSDPAGPVSIDSVRFMTGPRRRPGDAKDNVALFVKVRPANHAKAAEMAAAMNLSMAAFMDLLLQHVEVDDAGRPTCIPEDQEMLLAG